MSRARPFRRPVRAGRLAVIASAAVTLAACGSDTAIAPAPIPLESQVWATSLGVNLSQFTKLGSGVYYLDSQAGTGTTVSGTPTVAVQYAGFLANGTKFDERTAQQGSICFPLSGLIAGWQSGMQGMKVGGKRRLLIPPGQGYGVGGNGPIPGNANLLFDITLTATGCTP
jgi:FKBP-type peptidyl-prolyl cis-trans isomerase FkpA